MPLDFEIGVMDMPDANGTEPWRLWLRLKELITFGAGDEGDTALEPAFIFIGGGTNTVLTWTGLETGGWDAAWGLRAGRGLGDCGMKVASCLGAGAREAI